MRPRTPRPRRGRRPRTSSPRCAAAATSPRIAKKRSEDKATAAERRRPRLRPARASWPRVRGGGLRRSNAGEVSEHRRDALRLRHHQGRGAARRRARSRSRPVRDEVVEGAPDERALEQRARRGRSRPARRSSTGKSFADAVAPAEGRGDAALHRRRAARRASAACRSSPRRPSRSSDGRGERPHRDRRRRLPAVAVRATRRRTSRRSTRSASRVEADLRRSRAEAAAKEQAEKLLARAKEIGLERAAEEAKRRVEETEPFDRRTSSIPKLGFAPELHDAAFALTPEAPLGTKVYAAGGDAVVIALRERIPADMAGLRRREGRAPTDSCCSSSADAPPSSRT